MAEAIINDFHNYLENLKSKNNKHSEELDMKCRDEEEIHKKISIGFNNQDWTQCKSNFEVLSNNSKEMRKIMKNQSKITEDTFSLTEKILASNKNIEGRLALLENTKQILRYSDWIVILIDEIIVPKLMGDQNDWDRISTIFTKNEEDDRLFARLVEILDQVNITLGEFEYLVRLNKMRNTEFHINNQPLCEAKKQLEMTFPEHLEHFKEPLKKALYAIEVQWKNRKRDGNRNGNRKIFKRNR
ncbi:hypothetical protein RhiirA4_483321 [Rhizophagus irregularis]|uniref:Uncharacterized protein n=2 Tax=Rhizophagus irregularis TaxID=588596 RepID=A0A2I1HMG0_9GLOM|nr:hypothetical protein RhiirA4_483321 [Rhizophagus irregularis]